MCSDHVSQLHPDLQRPADRLLIALQRFLRFVLVLQASHSVNMTLLRMVLTDVAVPLDPEVHAMLLHTALLISLPRPLCPQFSLRDSLISQLYIPPHNAYSALFC